MTGGTLRPMSVRVRFAPSPTGMLHIGALRTVVYDHLFAKKHGGANILRIEDTDRSRYNPESEQEFIDSLRWAGIDFDEGPHVGGPHAPYRQSERKEAGVYEPYIRQLLESGHAYKAFDTAEELAAMRAAQEAAKQSTGYFGGAWRDATPEQVAAMGDAPFVVRLRIPRGRRIFVDDAIRGRIEWDSDTVDDPVLIKADGMPTYHFAAMVDDWLMEITHVLRGDEWISSAPKHAILYEAFGWEMPVIVHCPVIVGTDGKKLSKRHGATRVLDYAAQGFLPEAVKNFIALIGWSPGDDRELMPERELIEAFDLRGLQPSPGKFDIEKLRWLNGAYIRAYTAAGLYDLLAEFVRAPYVREYAQMEASEDEEGVDRGLVLARVERLVAADREYAIECIKLNQERVVTLADFGEACEFFVVEEPPMDEKAREKWLTMPHVPDLFGSLIGEGGGGDAEFWEAVVRRYAETHGFEKLGPIVHPIRVALTGKTTGPGLFELMAVLGPDRIRTRLARWG